jgi:hypothetical protein
MITRTSVLLLLIGAIVGYALGSPSVRAQTAQSTMTTLTPAVPVAEGDSLSIVFDRHNGTEYVRCKVNAIVGRYVRCAPGEGVADAERWHNLESAAVITKHSR